MFRALLIFSREGINMMHEICRSLSIGLLVLSVTGISIAARADESPFFKSEAVKDDALTEYRGTSGVESLGVAVLDATLQDNVSGGESDTGMNSIKDYAFQGSKGVVSVVQNTGNNVIIQSATIVNMKLNN